MNKASEFTWFKIAISGTRSRCILPLLLLAFLGCKSQETSSTEMQQKNWGKIGRQFVSDPAFRRNTLESSLINPQNGYGTVRLANYTENKWGALPILNPRCRPIRPEDIGKGTPKADDTWKRLDISDFSFDTASLKKLGEAMFTEYPAQMEMSMHDVLSRADYPPKYGLWQTTESIGGLIWVELPGGVFPSFSCSSCHADTNDLGKLVFGAPNHNINLGKARDDMHQRGTVRSDWGPGMADISADGVDNPIAIPDLRAVQFQPYLHRTANIKNSVPALAVRLDTGLVLSSRKARRPPREAVFALAHFVSTLGGSLPEFSKSKIPDVFTKNCSACHNGVGLTGEPVPIEKVGVNAQIAQSTDRTTGLMQVTSLRGVSSRKNLLCDGSIHSLEELLRTDRKRGGHYFGQDLSNKEKETLIRFLKSL